MAETASHMEDLTQKKCKPCEGGIPPMSEKQIREYLRRVPGWEFLGGEITRSFAFKNYYQTTAFVNAVAWIAHSEDHHPMMEFGYKNCTVRYSTHAISAISENDFICAAKINTLLKT